MEDYSSQARKIIRGYVQANTTLSTMREIDTEFMGGSENFTRWEQAEKKYGEFEWSESSFENFLRITKEKIEGDIEEISESYIDIRKPEEPSADSIINSFQQHSVSDEEIGRMEGFQYRVRDDGTISASYYYYTTDVDITSDLDIEEIPTQKRIRFEVIPERQLIVVETTSPAQVQKINSELNDRTSLKVDTTGNLNIVEHEAEEIVRSFIDTFEREDDDEL